MASQILSYGTSDESEAEATSKPEPVGHKRRKSSPQLDPIPDYTPTPLHVLEKRARLNPPTYSHNNNDRYEQYNPTPIGNNRSSSATTSLSRNVTPTTSLSSGSADSSDKEASKDCSKTNKKDDSNRRMTPRVSVFCPRPVTGPLVEAVAKRRASQTECYSSYRQKVQPPPKKPVTSTVDVQPHMWTPRIPSEIPEPICTPKPTESTNYTSPTAKKPRVSHKPTIPVMKSKRPIYPLSTSKNVPVFLRSRYLNIIIDEYLNTGHPEEQSYDDALKEEQALAVRAASKNIYINLVAGLKKRIREAAGISTASKNDNLAPCVSHEQILTGKVIGTFSIEKRKKCITDPSQMSERKLYEKLQRYILPSEELLIYGYPSQNPDNPEVTLLPSRDEFAKQTLRSEPAPTYTCDRCQVIYKVNEKRMPIDNSRCIFHPGRLWNERINKSIEKRYSCCKGDSSAGGCNSSKYHVQKGELELENYMGFVKTRPNPSKHRSDHGIFALDCEMCYTTIGLELTRLTIVNHKFDVIYEKLVRPKNFILDYNTKYSGLKDGDLDDVDTQLEDVQRDLLGLFSSQSILVGHSLDSDMKALKLIHGTVIDTAHLFPHKRGLPYKRALKTLVQEFLRVIIQDDAGHDSKEDAISSLKLVFWKLRTDIPEKATG